MCISLVLSERTRRVFGLTTTVSNLVIILLNISLFVAGIAIRIKLDSRLELLEDYDPGALSIYLMVTAGLLFLVHLVACKFCYDATYVSTRSSKHHYFVAIIVTLVVFIVYLFICFIVTLVHSSKIHSALELGMDKSMKAYGTDMVRKRRVDSVQVEFECCGTDSYKDWLSIPWVNMAFVNLHNPDVKSYAKRACIHHSIKSRQAHRAYQTGDTLNRKGCTDVMTSFFHSSLIAPTAILISVMLIIQVITVTLMRLLQTSIENADEMNDPEGDGAAYCMKSMGGGMDNVDYLKRKKSEDLEDAADHSEWGDESDVDEDNDSDDDEDSDFGASRGTLGNNDARRDLQRGNGGRSTRLTDQNELAEGRKRGKSGEKKKKKNEKDDDKNDGKGKNKDETGEKGGKDKDGKNKKGGKGKGDKEKDNKGKKGKAGKEKGGKEKGKKAKDKKEKDKKNKGKKDKGKDKKGKTKAKQKPKAKAKKPKAKPKKKSPKMKKPKKKSPGGKKKKKK